MGHVLSCQLFGGNRRKPCFEALLAGLLLDSLQPVVPHHFAATTPKIEWAVRSEAVAREQGKRLSIRQVTSVLCF